MTHTESLITDRGPSRNALPPRARFETDVERISLDGDWRFAYHPRIESAPSEPVRGDATLPVPGMWQLHGYGSPAYTNVKYPFPVDPPHVPDGTPLGDYQVDLELPSVGDRRVVLRFDGIDNSGDIWLNGVWIGRTKGSRNTHEFDVTDAAVAGRNDLRVRVSQWSATSYLEDQDMWWLSGIFRSVDVLLIPADGIRDIRVGADFDPADGSGHLRVEVDGIAGATDARISLPELGIVDVRSGEPVRIESVTPWSAEDPRLYTVVVSTASETATLPVGFRRITIADSQFLVNGIPVLFRGVNRHDHHPERGRAVTIDDVRADLLLMKRSNVNAIRTSHYPPPPFLLSLADELGFWVIDEADFETHGFVEVGERNNPVDDASWEDALVDRMQRMVSRDRNHPSIVMWSLGNESGPGRNLGPMRASALALDDTRPIHYERDYSFEHSDIFSLMYLTHETLERIGRFERVAARTGERLDFEAVPGLDEMPFILSEYAHAMGTGPGGLEDYQRLFRAYPRLAGGFIWEWFEHGLSVAAPDGGRRFAYGGDFGEIVHDSNFVADGLVSPERVARPALVDLTAVFRPVDIRVERDGVTIENLQERSDSSRFAFVVEWLDAAGRVQGRTLDVPVIEYGAEVRIDLDTPAGTVLTTVRAVLAEDSAWAPAGHEVAWGQSLLEAPAPPTIDSERAWTVDVAGISSTADDSASVIRLEGPRIGAWRAPTDNDLAVRMVYLGGTSEAQAWAHLHLFAPAARTVSAGTDDEGRTHIERHWGFAGRDVGIDTVWGSRIDRGALIVNASLTPVGPWPDGGTIPRLGLDFELPGLEPDTRVRWFGRGPGQSYPDTGAGARYGWFDATVSDLQEHYLRPQDNGVRADVHELRIEHSGEVLVVSGEPFHFSLRPWTDAEIDAAAHPDELPETGRLVLSLNAAVSGVGSAACGPGVQEEHRLYPSPVELALRFGILARGHDDA